MGFSSTDDFINEVTTNGKFLKAPFSKIYTGGTVVAGRWYDLTVFGGVPAAYTHGNMIFNGNFDGGDMAWTLAGGFVWTAATSLLTKTGGSTGTATQNTECVNGVSYSVVYTVAGYTGSGNIVISLGGTNGSNRTANGTYRETIVCGATANAPLVVTVPTTVTSVTIDTIAVTRDLGFTPYVNTGVGKEAGIWPGAAVSTDTKHLTNVGTWVNTAVGAPSVLMLVDMLGCYPRILTNSGSAQTLNNTLTLPRYTDGKGVMAFFSLNVTNGANAQNMSMVYTNSDSVGSRNLGATVANTASAVQSHIFHTGTAAGNFGPFLPLAAGDAGIKSVQTWQFSAASAGAGDGALVLCKPIASIPITTGFVAAERDLMNQIPSLPQIQDGAVLGLIVFSGAVVTAGTQWQGYLDFTWG